MAAPSMTPRAQRLQTDTSQHFLGGASHAERGQGAKLLLQFLIVGAPLELQEDSLLVGPSVIYQYPPNEPLVDQSVPLFCFPEGVRIRKLKRTASNSRVNEVRYSNLSTLEGPQRSFTFLLTGHEEVLYGVCVHSEEIYDELPSVCHLEAAPRLRAGTTTTTARQPAQQQPHACALRCYCLVSRFPFFKLHFNFLHTLLAKDRHVRMAGGAANDVELLIRGYSQVQVPEHGTALSFKLPGDVHEFAFVLPGHDQDSLLTEWCAVRLFALTVDTMVTLLAALVQEHRVVVQSQQLGTLTTFVLGLIPLLKPFVWQGALVPILPNSLAEALQAPTPYIFGMRRFSDMPDVAEVDLKELALLDLDKGTIAVPDDLQRLPREKALRSALQQGILTPQKHKAPLEAMAAVNEHLREEIKRIEKMVAEAVRSKGGDFDWESTEDVQAALATVKKDSHRSFYEKFFATQVWMGYVGAKLSERERAVRAEQEASKRQHEQQVEAQRRRAEAAVAKRFDAMIAAERQAVKELEGFIADYNRKLIMARERLDALLVCRAETLERDADSK